MNILLVIALIIGLILRLISLNQSLWLDEAVQIWSSTSFSVKDMLFKYMPGDFNPPTFHFITRGWLSLFSTRSEEIIRIPSVFLGMGCLYIFYRIIVLQKEKKVWFVSLLLLVTSPLHIYYSQEARMYILASFTFLLAWWRYLEFIRKKNTANSLLLGLGFILMGFSHFLTLFSLPVFFLWGLNQELGKKKKDWLLFFLPYLLFALSYLAYSPLFISQIKTGLGWQEQFPVWKTTVGSFSLKAAVLLPLKFVIGRIRIGSGKTYALISGILMLIFWGLAFLGVKDNFKLEKRKNGRKLKIKDQELFLTLLLLFFPPALGFLISFKISVFSYFRFLFVLPLFYLLIGKGLVKLKQSFGFWAVVVIGINLICSGVYLFNPNFHKENWRGMVGYLHAQNRYFNAPLIIVPQIEKPFLHYDQGKTEVIEAAQAQGPVVYLVSYSLPIFDPQDKIRQTLKQKGYQMKKGESFNMVGLEVWRN